MKKILKVHVKKKPEIVMYRTSTEGFSCEIKITDGKLSYVSFVQYGGGGGGYYSSPGKNDFWSCRGDAFDLMCRHDTDKFKSMLKSIKETDPENYNYGIDTLEYIKGSIIRKAKGESSKFDL